MEDKGHCVMYLPVQQSNVQAARHVASSYCVCHAAYMFFQAQCTRHLLGWYVGRPHAVACDWVLCLHATPVLALASVGCIQNACKAAHAQWIALCTRQEQ